jgi:hypothetical protein
MDDFKRRCPSPMADASATGRIEPLAGLACILRTGCRWDWIAATLLLLVFSSSPGHAAPFLKEQEIGNPFIQLSFSPYASVPLGDFSPAFSTGLGVGVSGNFRLGRLPVLSLGADAYLSFLPVRAENSVSVAGIALGPTFAVSLFPRLLGLVHLGAGAYVGFMGEGPMNQSVKLQVGPVVLASTSFELFLSPSLSVGLTGRCTYYWNGAAFIEVAPVLSYHIPSPRSPWLEVESLEFKSLFPALYRHYEGSPPGKTVVTNMSRFPAKDLRFEVNAERYTRGPAVGTVAKAIAPGESVTVALPVLLSESILGLTEGADLAADCRFDYVVQGKAHQSRESVRLTVRDRNAIEWDDDRKACLFVTEKDASVLKFSGSVAAILRQNEHPLLTAQFQKAVSLFTALAACGMSYVSDPVSPYARDRQINAPADFLKFPRQTLAYRAGDCDDLSVLYCALLESVGVESALITIPGHIYSAFRCDVSQAEVNELLAEGQDLISLDDRLWVPIETTQLAGGFLAAWEDGIRQWRIHTASGDARLYPVREAWGEYPPVGLPEESVELAIPTASTLQWSFEHEAGLMVAKYLEPALSRQLAAGDTPKIQSRVGILCARYGLYERALQMFARAGEYFPALVNAGSVLLLVGRPSEAAVQYERAGQLRQDHPAVLGGLARAYARLGDFERSRGFVARLETGVPAKADRSREPGAAEMNSRSAEVVDGEALQWEE